MSHLHLLQSLHPPLRHNQGNYSQCQFGSLVLPVIILGSVRYVMDKDGHTLQVTDIMMAKLPVIVVAEVENAQLVLVKEDIMKFNIGSLND